MLLSISENLFNMTQRTPRKEELGAESKEEFLAKIEKCDTNKRLPTGQQHREPLLILFQMK